MNNIQNILKAHSKVPFEPISTLKDLQVSIKNLDISSKSLATLEKKGDEIVLYVRQDVKGFKRTFLLSQQVARIALGQLDKTPKIETKELDIDHPSSLLDELANNEAMELLTPKKEIKKITSEGCFDIEVIADHFRVLEPVMYSRMKKLKLISD